MFQPKLTQSPSTNEERKKKRDRLFRKSRPFVRPFDPERDIFPYLWAAYDLGSFPDAKPGLSREEYAASVKSVVALHSQCLIVEDDDRHFKSGRGPVAFVTVDNFGWRIEPYFIFFRWATPRMRLRAHVAFYQMVRYSSDIGVCVVRSPERYVQFFSRLQDYGILFPCGKIPYGSAEGHEFLFSVKGQRKTKELKKAA